MRYVLEGSGIGRMVFHADSDEEAEDIVEEIFDEDGGSKMILYRTSTVRVWSDSDKSP